MTALLFDHPTPAPNMNLLWGDVIRELEGHWQWMYDLWRLEMLPDHALPFTNLPLTQQDYLT